MKKVTLVFALLFVSLLSNAQEHRSASATSGGDLLIYPNSSSSSVTITPGPSDSGLRHLRIYNLQGVLVEDRIITPAEGTIVIDLSDYEDGISVIALTDDNDYNRRSGGGRVKRR